MLMGLSAGREGGGLQLVPGLGNYDAGTEARVLAELLAQRPSAVVLTGLDHSPRTRMMLGQAAVPVVEILKVTGWGSTVSQGCQSVPWDCRWGRPLLPQPSHCGFAALAPARRPPLGKRLCRICRGTDGRRPSRCWLCDLRWTKFAAQGEGRWRLRLWPEVEFFYCTNDMIAAGQMILHRLSGAPTGPREEIVLRIDMGATLQDQPVSPGTRRVGTTVTS